MEQAVCSPMWTRCRPWTWAVEIQAVQRADKFLKTPALPVSRFGLRVAVEEGESTWQECRDTASPLVPGWLALFCSILFHPDLGQEPILGLLSASAPSKCVLCSSGADRWPQWSPTSSIPPRPLTAGHGGLSPPCWGGAGRAMTLV